MIVQRPPTLRRAVAVRRSQRLGFTLVELMAVIAIIAILASVVLGALWQADKASKGAKTRSLIQKMSNMMMGRYDSYRTMRMPLYGEGRTMTGDSRMGERQKTAVRRLLALREWVQMEMPDRYTDLTSFQPVVLRTRTGTPIRPNLWLAYNNKINGLAADRGVDFGTYIAQCDDQYQSAELLYLILTTAVDDSSISTEHFNAGDSGDADFDGMREFHDGWGSPIEFIRWAPGFESTMQPLFRYANGDAPYSLFNSSQPTDDSGNRVSRWHVKVETVIDPANLPNTKQRIVVVEQTDPLNPMRIGTKYVASVGRFRPWEPGDPPPEYGYFLMPLIYSIGPDLRSGINHLIGASVAQSPSDGIWPAGDVTKSDPYNLYQNNYTGNNDRYPIAFRGESTYEGYDLDNIHNQNTEIE